MHDRIEVFLWALCCTAVFGAVGAAFGAVAAAMMRANGRAVGGVVGETVASAFARVSERQWSPVATAALKGAADGAFFLTLLGSIVGLVAGCTDRPAAVVGVACVAVVLLALGAAGLGVLAYAIVHAGLRAVASGFAAAMVGALVGARLGKEDGLFLGIVLGGLLGTLGGCLVWPRRPDDPPSDSD
jgi:hypothetical protein